MNNLDDCIGMTFNRLTLVAFHEKRGRRKFAHFQCSCGNKYIGEFSSVACGRTKSCGCLSRETSSAQGRANAVHGMTKTPEYNVWGKMIARCTNHRDRSYPNYGGRGITVCDRWRVFQNFFDDMGRRPSNKHSIERIDVDGNYEPANCVWATTHEQCRNKRNTVKHTLGDEQLILGDIAEKLGVSRETLVSRMARGMTAQEAVSKPVRRISRTRRNEQIEFQGVSDTAFGWSRRIGIPFKTLLYRLNCGWSVEKAMTAPVRKWPGHATQENILEI